jgi:hypothetical protein
MAIFSLQEVKIEQVKNVRDGNFASWPEYAVRSYTLGGGPTGNSNITRFSYNTETFAGLPGKISRASVSIAGTQSSIFGYGAGGFFPAYLSRVDRLSFSTETSSITTNLPSVRSRASGISADLYGYYGGGVISPPGATISTITRLSFSNDTMNNPGNNLPTTKRDLNGVQSTRFGFGYFSAGQPPVNTQINRISFATESVSIIGTAPVNFGAASISSINYGYDLGGWAFPGPILSSIRRLDFSNGTISTIPNRMTYSASDVDGNSSISYGYTVGGSTPTLVSITNRLDFSSETISASTNLLVADGPGAQVFGGQSV